MSAAKPVNGSSSSESCTLASGAKIERSSSSAPGHAPHGRRSGCSGRSPSRSSGSCHFLRLLVVGCDHGEQEVFLGLPVQVGGVPLPTCAFSAISAMVRPLTPRPRTSLRAGEDPGGGAGVVFGQRCHRRFLTPAGVARVPAASPAQCAACVRAFIRRSRCWPRRPRSPARIRGTPLTLQRRRYPDFSSAPCWSSSWRAAGRRPAAGRGGSSRTEAATRRGCLG
jgi:hypothetical protein